MTARILDGKAVALAIREDLTRRVAELAARGITPGLGTVLVGDDPGSRAYVSGKHRDSAQVGIASIRRELPADATQDEVEAVVDELNARPGLHRLPGRSCRCPPGSTRSGCCDRVDPDKDADGLHPLNLGKLVLGEPGPVPGTPEGIIELLRRYDIPLTGAEVTVIGRGITVGPHARPAADPAQRERHRDALPHRHQGPRRAHQERGHRDRRGRAARAADRGHDQARRRGRGRGHHPHGRRAGRRRRSRGWPRWPGGSRRCPAAWAR